MKNHPQTVMVALVLRLLLWSSLAIAQDCLDSSKECVEQLTEKAIADSAKLKTLDDRIALIDKRLGVLTDYLILTLFEGGSGKLLTVTVEWEKTVDIRLIVVDVDGTIAGDNNQVNPAVVQAVSAVQKKGIPVAIGTGRMYRSALRFHQRLKSTLPLIAYNGAWIQDPVSQVHHRHTPISPDLAIDLLDYLEQPQWQGKISLNFYMDDVLYVRQLNAETEFYRQRSGIIAEAVGDLRKVAHKTTKILAMGEDKQFIAEIWQHLQQRYQNQDLYFTQSSPTFFEVTHVEATKGSATQFLAEDILGLQPQNVMAIGDNFNDVSMLTYAGLGVAMGNAPQAVKDQADWVAPSVNLNGVAAALEKFVLI